MSLIDPKMAVPPEAEPPGLGSRLRNWFLTGLILVGPLYITVGLGWWLVTWFDEVMHPFIPVWLRTETYLPFRIPGIGLIMAVGGLTLLGFLTANLIGRRLVEFSEDLLHRMPVVRPIYRTMKQIFETLFGKSGTSFRKVALVEFPPGKWSVVFLSLPPHPDIAARLPGDREASSYVSCFLPCTPNPTTGFYFFARREDVIEIDIPVQEAMALIMSAGMVQPGGGTGQDKLATLAEAARQRRAAS